MRRDKAFDHILGQSPRFADARHLAVSIRGGDMRIETASGGRDAVCRDRTLNAIGPYMLNIALYAVDEFLRRRSEIRAAGIGGVVGRIDRFCRIGRIGCARRRGAAMKIFRIRIQ